MGRYNEKKDVFHEERMLSGTKNHRQEFRGRRTELVASRSVSSGINTPRKVRGASIEHRCSLLPLKS